MFVQPIVEKLQKESKNVLLVGMGGGYDIFAGIPLYYELRDWQSEAGEGQIVMANLSFVKDLRQKATRGRWVTPVCNEVRYAEYEAAGDKEAFAEYKQFPGNYFPEWHLSKYFHEADGDDVPVYTFDLYQATVASLTESYAAICAEKDIDTIVLVDAGVDSLLKHNEEGLGTVAEDLMSILACRAVPCEHKYLMCLGMGSEGRISDHDFLENWAEVQRMEGFLGSFGLHDKMPSVKRYHDAYEACAWAGVPANTTINTAILLATQGAFGKQYPEKCPRGFAMQTTPLMAMCTFFDATVVFEFKLFLDELEQAGSLVDVQDMLGRIRVREGLTESYTGSRHVGDSFAPHEGKYLGVRYMRD